MVGVFVSSENFLNETYNGLVGFFGSATSLNLFFSSILIAVVALFIWKFYNSLSEIDLISLNLKKYNRYEHPLYHKLLAIFLFFIEYIVVMPALIFFWFAALSILLLIISPEREIGKVLLITGSMVGAVRILAYHRKEISKELAKLFPFIALSVFLLTPGVLDFPMILSRISEIPSFFGNIVSFVIIIFVIEIILRVLFTILEFWKSEEGNS